MLGGEPHPGLPRRAYIEATDNLLRSTPQLSALGEHAYDKMTHLDLACNKSRENPDRQCEFARAQNVAQAMAYWAEKRCGVQGVPRFAYGDAVGVLAGVIDRQAHVQGIHACADMDLRPVRLTGILVGLRAARLSAADPSIDTDLWREIFGDATILVDYPELRARWVSAVDYATAMMQAHTDDTATGEDPAILTVAHRWTSILPKTADLSR